MGKRPGASGWPQNRRRLSLRSGVGVPRGCRYWAASSAGASWPRAGGPVLTATWSGALAPVGLSFPSKAGFMITLRAEAPLFSLPPAHESLRTPLSFLSPTSNSGALDGSCRKQSAPMTFLGKHLKSLSTVGNDK